MDLPIYLLNWWMSWMGRYHVTPRSYLTTYNVFTCMNWWMSWYPATHAPTANGTVTESNRDPCASWCNNSVEAVILPSGTPLVPDIKWPFVAEINNIHRQQRRLIWLDIHVHGSHLRSVDPHRRAPLAIFRNIARELLSYRVCQYQPQGILELITVKWKWI